MRQRILFTLLWVAFLLPAASAQKNQMFAKNYQKDWTKADSLIDKGLPKSAATVVQKILQEAQQKKDSPNAIRAQLFLMSLSAQTEENANVSSIKKAEDFIQQSSNEEKALWQSIAAQLYWNYFQRNRWKLYDRGTLEGQASDDINTWDAPAFFKKTGDLYLASLEQKTILEKIPIERYTPILIEGKNTRALRPSLYDFLAFRAISFFQNDEKDLINPADQFQIGGNPWFNPAENFSNVSVKVKNAASLHFRALQLYQEIIAAHLHDAQPDALIDADLQRLEFVYQKSNSPEKANLYRKALDQLQGKYSQHPAWAQISYLLAVLDMGQEPTQTYPRGRGPKTQKPNRDLAAIRKQLQHIISKYPNTEGGTNAFNLLQSIELKSLEVKTEEVSLPAQNTKALISYKNTASVYLKIYRVSNQLNLNNNYTNSDTLLKQLESKIPLRSWQQQLPGSEDMEQHSTEINIGRLDQGAYLLVAALKDQLNAAENIVTATRFQVSNISFVLDNEKRMYVLHRETGYPITDAKVQFWAGKYDSDSRKERPFSLGTAQSNAEGAVTLPPMGGGNYERSIKAVRLVSGTDTLQMNGYLHTYAYPEAANNSTYTKTIFFTDRAIYRPGQTIYFKGIMIQSRDGGRSNEVISGQKTRITLLDVNSQAIGTLDLVTNAFGSFNGQFTAPESVLGGQMRLENNSGSVYFSVEEYKRPKFYVAFDTLKGNYSLDQEIRVKSYAKAYAGNTIDGATVNYRVVRQAKFPYYWCYYRMGMPVSPQVEITNGTTITGADGSFEINFTTLPDRMISKEALPTFTYTVYADVTDINGETRSSQTSINCGYRSLQLVATLPEEGSPKTLENLEIRTENMNGVFTPATVEVVIAPLQFPGIFRKRLWEKPDQFVLSEADFRKAFPNDEYREESQYMNWEEGAPIYSNTFTTKPDSFLHIPQNVWKQKGWYVVEIKTKDTRGNEITEKKYTYVWSPSMKGVNQKDIGVYTNQTSYQPGDDLQMWLSTSIEKPYLLRNSSKAYKVQDPIKITLSEEDRGGLSFSWLYVHHNRVYQIAKIVDVPWDNKDLRLEWATRRDKLLPGASEEWRLTIKGNKKEKVAAELVAGMYDASLDAFREHQWHWDKLFPSLGYTKEWNSNYNFGIANNQGLRYLPSSGYQSFDKQYDELSTFGLGMDGDGYGGGASIRYRSLAAPMALASESKNSLEAADVAQKTSGNAIEEREAAAVPPGGSVEKLPTAEGSPQIRKNLQETAFFLPQLTTDEEGNIQLKLTLPEALTEWKLMAFAHTKDWKTGYVEGKIKTQKDLMIVPNLPRFLRQKDQMIISTKIANLSTEQLNGTATLEILDAATMQPLQLSFQLKDNQQPFTVQKGQSTTAEWRVQVPESRYTPVVVRILATAGNFSDGEENTLPVVSNRMLVTETLPLPVRGSGTKTFTLNKLLQQQSNTLSNYALTVEFTGNPAWYAVQALPYLMEYPYECAEQTFNRFYANALAGYIVAKSPKVKQIFDQWKTQDTAALLSNLEKNQELKSALLEETPWVLEAKNEQEQKHRIAALFETHQLARELAANLKKLEQMQLPEGGFPWFIGMQSDRFITQYIVTGIGKLQQLQNTAAQDRKATTILAKALPYLDLQLQEDYEQLIRNKAAINQQQIGYAQIQYLYMRSFYSTKAIHPAAQKAFDYYKKQAAQYWNNFNPYMKGQIALALKRFKAPTTPTQIMASLKETAIVNEEMGMYWKEMPAGYWWYEAPIEAQSLLIEAFTEVAADAVAADALKVWLLKQKQTQNWKTTKATADACYALLLNGSDWLRQEPQVTINLGSEIIQSTAIKTEAGTGYFKKKYMGAEVKKEMGTIKVTVLDPAAKTKEEGVSWGAVYWQYFEDLDKITSAATPLSLKKQLYLEKNSDKGPVLTAVKEGDMLNVGDKVKIRIELRSDRDMEYVHLKDMRAACMEPVNVLSGYKYQGGLGYYESTKDIATNFFFNYLRKGTYVFEYVVHVSAKGNFSNGIATIQCMYAPEFSSHSEGIRIQVK